MMYMTVIKGIVACLNAGLAILFGLCIVVKDNLKYDPLYWFSAVLFTINSIFLLIR